MNKQELSERDICTKYITPAIKRAGWDIQSQVREEVTLTAGQVVVRGRLTSRKKGRRADYVLNHKPNIPLAVIEAKDNKHSVGSGMQQAQAYAEMLDVANRVLVTLTRGSFRKPSTVDRLKVRFLSVPLPPRHQFVMDRSGR